MSASHSRDIRYCEARCRSHEDCRVTIRDNRRVTSKRVAAVGLAKFRGAIRFPGGFRRDFKRFRGTLRGHSRDVSARPRPRLRASECARRTENNARN